MGFLAGIKSKAARVTGLGLKVAAGFRWPKKGPPGVLVLPALGLAALLGLLVILRGISHSSAERPPAPPEVGEALRVRPIPPEELFSPEEPDFLPRLRPGREPRAAWTQEDTGPYWTGFPAGGAVFLDLAEPVIDALMERVP
jgi:hypothetical protein